MEICTKELKQKYPGIEIDIHENYGRALYTINLGKKRECIQFIISASDINNYSFLDDHFNLYAKILYKNEIKCKILGELGD